jgi:hypothetical protein
MLRSTTLTAVALVVLATGLGCKTVDNANKMMNSITELAQNMNSVINAAKGAATTVTTAAPLAGSNLPALPASATGGKDLTQAQPGKSGTTQADVDGDGTTEQVNVFTSDADGTTYLSWEQDGTCYLSWKDAEGAEHLAFSACASPEGYFTCEVVGESAECSACNLDNECASCDMQGEEGSCVWPGAVVTEDVVSDTGYEDSYLPDDVYVGDSDDPCAEDGFCNDACEADPDCGAGDSCDECLDAYCSAEDATCSANTDCVSLFQCILECADDACATACQDTYAGGVTDLEAYLTCQDTYCFSECM